MTIPLLPKIVSGAMVALVVADAFRHPRSGHKLLNHALMVGILLILSAIILPGFGEFTLPPHKYCIADLKQLQGAKATWALEKHKTGADTPKDSDLFGPGKYIRENPICRQGGTYRLGKIGEPVTCSLGGVNHTLPKEVPSCCP